MSNTAIHLSPPWHSNIEAWFFQTEAQFFTRGITTEQAKFCHILQVLDEATMTRLMAYLALPPSDSPYTALKAELIRLYQPSDKQRFNALVHTAELGDQRPSDLMRRMQNLLPPHSRDDAFFRQMFLDKLPSAVQPILAAFPSSTTLQELAGVADKVVEAYVPAPIVAALPTTDSVVAQVTALPTDPEKEHLRQEVASLRRQLSQLRTSSQRRPSASPRFSRDRTPTRSRRGPSPSAGECWYHHNFGKRAYRCQSPCSWSENPAARE